MTTQTIRNGTSIDVPIPTGQTLKVVAVTGTYTITVTRGTGIGTALGTAATGGSYGAYAYDSVVRIVASSASEIDFDVAVTPVVDSDTEPKFAFDSTGAVTGLVGPGGSRIDYARKARLPKTITQSRKVMGAPVVPTAGAHAITGLFWSPLAGPGGANAVYSGGAFSYSRSGTPIVSGVINPKYNIARLSAVNYGSSGNGFTSNVEQWSFMTYATTIEIVMYSYSVNFLVKINDEYTSLTPTGTGAGGAAVYYTLTFGSTALRRVDVIVNGSAGNGSFAGVWTGATETVYPAPVRGSTMVVFGDSFVEGGTSTYGACESYPVIMGEALGLDNVVSSGVGATGFLGAGAGKLTYRGRLSTDLTPFASTADYVFFQCSSFNDAGSSIAELQAEWALTLAAAKAIAPNVAYGFIGPMSNGGPSKTTAACWAHHNAAKQFCTDNDLLFISCLEQRLPSGTAAFSTTLSGYTSTTSFATTASLAPGQVYKFADGTRFRCKTSSGGGPANIVPESALGNAQIAGATVTLCGQSVWSGTGRIGTTASNGNCDVLVNSDDVHPSSQGQLVIGLALAAEFILATQEYTVT